MNILRKLILLTFLFSCQFFNFAAAQDCTVTVTIGGADVTPCEPGRIDMPVYMNNPCTVGGFSTEILSPDTSFFKFDPNDSLAVDLIGARHTNWLYFDFSVHPDGHKVSVAAIGTGGFNLPPGDGLIFTVHGDNDNLIVSDTCLLLNFGTTNISDSTGYNFYPRTLVLDSLCIGPCDTNFVRGDANMSGTLSGLDVIYLVSYLKGGPSFCLACRCLGDANTSGTVNGLDVTFLVLYFKEGWPVPDPPNCIE